MGSAFIYGGKARCCSARCGILLLFFLLLHQTYALSCFSSCGKISNITHPFRLKHDPDHCGDNRYELDCVNNVTVLKLDAGEFYVQSINYDNYTIRLVDPNIQPTNCSSLPRFFLYDYNFSDPHLYYSSRGRLVWPIFYMNCTSPPSDDAYYVRTAPCVDQHMYAFVGDLELGRLKPQCYVKLVTVTSLWIPGGYVSYADIHRALRYGFELSWMQAYCPCDYCYRDGTTGEIQHNKCGYWDNMLLRVTGSHSRELDLEVTQPSNLEFYKMKVLDNTARLRGHTTPCALSLKGKICQETAL